MPGKTTLTVRLNRALSDFVEPNVAADGDYENVSEYLRDLIRRDKARKEAELFERLQAELHSAFSQPDTSYIEVTADELSQRYRGRQ